MDKDYYFKTDKTYRLFDTKSQLADYINNEATFPGIHNLFDEYNYECMDILKKYGYEKYEIPSKYYIYWEKGHKHFCFDYMKNRMYHLIKLYCRKYEIKMMFCPFYQIYNNDTYANETEIVKVLEDRSLIYSSEIYSYINDGEEYEFEKFISSDKDIEITLHKNCDLDSFIGSMIGPAIINRKSSFNEFYLFGKEVTLELYLNFIKDPEKKMELKLTYG